MSDCPDAPKESLELFRKANCHYLYLLGNHGIHGFSCLIQLSVILKDPAKASQHGMDSVFTRQEYQVCHDSFSVSGLYS